LGGRPKELNLRPSTRIKEGKGSSYRAFGAHEFVGPLVSHCCAKTQAKIHLRGSSRKRAVRAISLSALTSLSNPWFRTAVRLPFVCSSKRKEAKEKTPGLRVGAKRAEPLRCAGRRVRPELGSLWRSSDSLATPALCAGNPSALCFSFASHGAGIQQVAHSSESVQLHTGTEAVGCVLVGLRFARRPTQIVTLSERQRACLYSSPWA